MRKLELESGCNQHHGQVIVMNGEDKIGITVAARAEPILVA